MKRLEKALKIGGNTHNPADIWAAVKEGKMQAFQNGESVAVTEVVGYPQKRVIQVVLAVGNLNEVLGLIPEMEEFGRKHGCSSIRMFGRRGWSKVLSRIGWKPPGVIYEKVL